MAIIIGLTGYKQSGKDTFCDRVRDQYGPQSVLSYAFANPLYRVVKTLFSPLPMMLGTTDLDKDQIVPPTGRTLRHLLQTLGTEWGRNHVDPDLWVLLGKQWLTAAIYQTEGYEDRFRFIVFTDIRFDNEAEMVREAGGKIIQVIRPDEATPDSHASELGIKPTLVDRVVMNSGTLEDYHKHIDTVIEDITCPVPTS